MTKLTLNNVANIILISTCALFIANLGFGEFHRSSSRQPPAYRPGDVIKDTGELQLNKSNKTLILITASTCHFCSESMPFYRRLSEKAKSAGTRIVAVSAEDINVNREYLLSNSVPVELVASITKSGIVSAGTPTLLLVRSDGKVINSWRGRLDEPGERQVFGALAAR